MVLRDQTGEELAPGVQGVDMDGVAVLGEQLGQAELAHVAPHHPKIQFMVHSGPPIFVLPQIMRGGGEG